MTDEGLTRRTVLRNTGSFVGALGVGGLATGGATAGSGADGRPGPGEVLTFGELYRRGVPFTVGPVITDDANYPRCRAPNSPNQPYDGIAIVYDDSRTSAIAIPGDQDIQKGSRYEFAAAKPVDCKYDAERTVVRTAMKPVK